MRRPAILLVFARLAIASVITSQVKLPEPETRPIKFDESFYSDTNKQHTFIEWLAQILSRPMQTTTTEIPENEETSECPSCDCGLTNKHNRIVGGSETEVNEYPWMAMLLYKGKFYCGGSVINSKYILTAAHCVDRFQREYITVRLLEHHRDTSTESNVITYNVQQITKHSGYSAANYNNDIALLKVAGRIKFEGKMRPVCLPDRGKTFTGSKAIVTGWGAMSEGGSPAAALQEVTVPIMSNAECRATKYPARKITENMLCAGYPKGAKDSCQGDSGGPLHIINDTAHKIVGIVSWGEGCAQPNYPGVYARVNRYLTWIERNTPDGCYC